MIEIKNRCNLFIKIGEYINVRYSKKEKKMKQENKIGNYMPQNNLEMTRVVEDYYHYISAIIKNTHTICVEDEEEMISDVFLIIWKNKDKLDKNARFSSYIAGITKNVMYRKYKEIKRTIETVSQEEDLVDKFDIDSIIEQQEMNRMIIQNIKQIGSLNYEIFTKFYYDGMTVKQIAKEMNLSVSNVKTKLHRTRKKVKRILELGGYKR